MKNFTIKLFVLCVALGSLSLNAQDKNVVQTRECATDEYNQLLLQTNPKMMGSDAFERELAPKVAAIKAQMASNPQRVLQFTIPVVVHVIHNGEPIGTGANISDAQVISQIQVLNEDFRRMIGTRGFNSNPVGADVEVEFCLAQQTPDGCITNGIDRIDMSSVSTTWSGPGGNTDSVLKPATIWDSSKYMNMWSVNFSSSTLLGFAQFPGGPANTDGVVSNYTYFGSNDAPGVNIPGVFNLGRTMTHEVGHYLGLYHTFEGGCTGSVDTAGDFCSDTPPVASANSNGSACVPNNSCSTDVPNLPDMIENYMDYTTDACMNIFTLDQKARVIAVLNGVNNNRPDTSNSNVCTPLAPVNNDVSIQVNSLNSNGACTGNFTPNVRVQNYGTTSLTSAILTYNVDGGSNSTFNWVGSLANGQFVNVELPAITVTSGGSHTYNISASSPNGSSDQRACNNSDALSFESTNSYPTTTEIRLNIIPDNYGAEIRWTFKSGNTTLYSGGPYTNGNTNPINQVFPVNPNNCYTFTITDSAGDGICCGFGIGSYTLKTDNNTTIRLGADYGASEVTQISTIALGVDEYFADGNVSLYPNPTSNQLTIKVGQTNDLPNGYEIYNMLGQSINKKEISTNADMTIDASALSNGMYFIRISKDNASVTLPFIKK